MAAALVGIQVGSAIVATRFVLDQTQPASLALLRYGIGVLCLLPFLLNSVRSPFTKRDLIPISLLGITQFGIAAALLNYALQFIPSARAALMFATLPLQTMLIASLLGYERLSVAKSFGVLLTIIGVGFALGDKAFEVGGAQGWTGEIVVLLSAFAGALCSVFYRPYLKKYPTLQISSLAMLASVIFLAFVAVGEGFFTTVPRFTLGGWFAVLFIGGGSAIGYYLWLWALNNTTPTKVTIFLALNPITATALGTLFLGEKTSIMLIIGVACVALGLSVAHWEALPAPGFRDKV
jgi:drug/metabolite transporter (DMT)-like permease